MAGVAVRGDALFNLKTRSPSPLRALRRRGMGMVRSPLALKTASRMQNTNAVVWRGHS